MSASDTGYAYSDLVLEYWSTGVQYKYLYCGLVDQASGLQPTVPVFSYKYEADMHPRLPSDVIACCLQYSSTTV